MHKAGHVLTSVRPTDKTTETYSTVRKLILTMSLAVTASKAIRSFHPVVTGVGRKIPIFSLKLCLAPCASRTYLVRTYKPQETSLRNYNYSFQAWVLSLFQNNPNYSSFDVQKSDCDLSELDGSCVEFDTLLNYLWTKKAQEELTPLLLRKMDALFCAKISPTTPAKDLLKCLQVFTMTVPIQASQMDSFKNAIIQLENRIKKSQLSPHDIVQTMYYASHMKNRIVAKKFMQAALYHLDVGKMENMNATDLGVYCVSLFRSAVPLDKDIVLKFLDERFRNEMPTLIKDHPAIFVSFVKCFRISKYYDEGLLNCTVSQGLDRLCEMDVIAKIHLGVWFAASEFGNVEFVKSFLSACAAEVSVKIAENAAPRLKDIDNLLWSLATYGFPDINDEIQRSNIPAYVRDRLCLARNDLHLQISLLLWLWIGECRLEKDVARCIVPENIRIVKDSKHFKSVANLFLLMTCAEVESPGLLKPNILNSRDYRLQPKIPQYLEKRPRLKNLLATLQKNREILQLSNVRFSFQLQALYIGGIYAEYQGKPFSIEVMDPTVCLSNSQLMKGRMRLKLRLLKKMGIPVLKVTDIEPFCIEDFERRLKQLFPTNEIQG